MIVQPLLDLVKAIGELSDRKHQFKRNYQIHFWNVIKPTQMPLNLYLHQLDDSGGIRWKVHTKR